MRQMTLIKKEHLYYSALIGLGFLWTGTSFMAQTYRILGYLDGDTVNLIVCGFYYILQAAGLGLAAILFKKAPLVAGGKKLPFYASLTAISCLILSFHSSCLPAILIAVFSTCL